MIIANNFHFESAHKLDGHKGRCGNLHGHSYTLTVKVEGVINKNGMVIDFSTLEKIVKREVVDILDHQYLNGIIKLPTAENILLFIDQRLSNKLPICELKLRETRDSYVILKKANEGN